MTRPSPLLFNIKAKLNPGRLLVVFAEIPIVLIVVYMVEEGDPLAEFSITILHEELLRDSH
jgi:hypothetical protein